MPAGGADRLGYSLLTLNATDLRSACDDDDSMVRDTTIQMLLLGGFGGFGWMAFGRGLKVSLPRASPLGSGTGAAGAWS